MRDLFAKEETSVTIPHDDDVINELKERAEMSRYSDKIMKPEQFYAKLKKLNYSDDEPNPDPVINLM